MQSPFAVGEIFADKYKIEHVLGVGGMGVVLAAKHIQLHERVAIKVLLPGALANPEIVTRFLREARTAARIRSEYVARVLDVGALATGEPYIIMEFLDGSDLSAVIRDGGPMATSTAVGHVLQACEALAAVHASQIVHRDLKPANLFLTTRNDGTTVIKLIDFGISKVTLPSEDGDDFSTKSAVMMGSPHYMAPEQMLSTRNVDARSDIWSLGVILYHLLTGARPFPANSILEIYNLVQRGAPLLRSALPGAPEGLERCISRCLQHDRENRYTNVAELCAGLAEFGPANALDGVERCARILHVRTPSAPAVPPSSPAPVPAASSEVMSAPFQPVPRAIGWNRASLLGMTMLALGAALFVAQRGRAPASQYAASDAPTGTALTAVAETPSTGLPAAMSAASAPASTTAPRAGAADMTSASTAPAPSSSARSKPWGKLAPPALSSSVRPVEGRPPSQNDIVNPWVERAPPETP